MRDLILFIASAPGYRRRESKIAAEKRAAAAPRRVSSRKRYERRNSRPDPVAAYRDIRKNPNVVYFHHQKVIQRTRT